MTVVLRAFATLAFVMLSASQEPNLGIVRPLARFASLERLETGVIAAVTRVRADFAAHHGQARTP